MIYAKIGDELKKSERGVVFKNETRDKIDYISFSNSSDLGNIKFESADYKKYFDNRIAADGYPLLELLKIYEHTNNCELRVYTKASSIKLFIQFEDLLITNEHGKTKNKKSLIVSLQFDSCRVDHSIYGISNYFRVDEHNYKVENFDLTDDGCYEMDYDMFTGYHHSHLSARSSRNHAFCLGSDKINNALCELNHLNKDNKEEVLLSFVSELHRYLSFTYDSQGYTTMSSYGNNTSISPYVNITHFKNLDLSSACNKVLNLIGNKYFENTVDNTIELIKEGFQTGRLGLFTPALFEIVGQTNDATVSNVGRQYIKKYETQTGESVTKPIMGRLTNIDMEFQGEKLVFHIEIPQPNEDGYLPGVRIHPIIYNMINSI